MLGTLGLRAAAITGDLSVRERTAIQTAYNQGQYDVLGITAAGAEGLNLLRTREVHILDGNWNRAAVEQAIGRAVRRGSHAGLDEGQRNVHIYEWITTIPVANQDEIPMSADQRLHRLAMDKQLAIDRLMGVLQSFTIDTALPASQ